MKRTDNPQTNTRIYWNHVYRDCWHRAQYAQDGTVTDPESVGNLYIRPSLRFESALSYVKDKDKVIDLGCGVGKFTKMVKKKFPECEVWGTDISNKAIEDNLQENPDIKYYFGYIGNQDFLPSDYFDVVFCGEVIEHLDNPSDLFTEAYRILKKGGMLIVTTPVEDRVFSEEHMWYFEKKDLKNFFTDAGFKTCTFVKLPDMEYMIVFFVVGKK